MGSVLRGRSNLADVRSFIGELYGPDLHAKTGRVSSTDRPAPPRLALGWRMLLTGHCHGLYLFGK
jgi:hypothetical protein